MNFKSKNFDDFEFLKKMNKDEKSWKEEWNSEKWTEILKMSKNIEQ